MLALSRLLMLLFAMETAPIQSEEPDEVEDQEEGEEATSELGSEDEEGESDEDIRDPRARLKAEQEKMKRLSGKLTRAEEELAEAQTALRESRVESAFHRAVISRAETIDLETAWDLATIRGFMDTVQVSDAGEVAGIDEALTRLLDRYPWLREEPPAAAEPDPSRPMRTAPPPKKRRDGAASQHSDASMKERFPALRKAGR